MIRGMQIKRDVLWGDLKLPQEALSVLWRVVLDWIMRDTHELLPCGRAQRARRLERTQKVWDRVVEHRQGNGETVVDRTFKRARALWYSYVVSPAPVGAYGGL